MRSVVEKVMAKHGTDLTIVSNGESKTARGQYVYMGSVGAAVQEGDTLKLGGREYLFRRVERYYYGNEALYQWGLCVEKGVNDTWGTQSLS